MIGKNWNETIQGMFAEERTEREVNNVTKDKVKVKKIKKAKGTKKPAERVTVTPALIRPSVNEVALAFHLQASAVREVFTRHVHSKHLSQNAIQAKIDVTMEELRAKLQGWGIADKIDWDRED